MKLRPYVECIKPGYDGCVNTEGAEHAQAGYHHWCPACQATHGIAVERPLRNQAGREIRWGFDGNMEAPTFTPSVLVFWTPKDRNNGRCHYFIRNGMIEFCADSTHELAGQTVPLPDYPTHDD